MDAGFSYGQRLKPPRKQYKRHGKTSRCAGSGALLGSKRAKLVTGDATSLKLTSFGLCTSRDAWLFQ
jgi:hypothetical protein